MPSETSTAAKRVFFIVVLFLFDLLFYAFGFFVIGVFGRFGFFGRF
jgi:hypothetical protein